MDRHIDIGLVIDREGLDAQAPVAIEPAGQVGKTLSEIGNADDPLPAAVDKSLLRCTAGEAA